METALLEIGSATSATPLVHLDVEGYLARVRLMDREEKLAFPEKVAPAATPEPSAGPVAGAPTYDDTLLFITAAQEECYRFFGQLMDSKVAGRASLEESVHDAVDGDGDGGLDVGESVQISEWSQEEQPARKKGRK